MLVAAGNLLAATAPPDGRNVPAAMEDAQHFYAVFRRAIEDHLVTDRKMPNLAAQIRATFAHLGLCRIELELLLDRVEQAKRDRAVLAFPGDVSANLLEVLARKRCADDAGPYLLRPCSSSSSASSFLMAFTSRGSDRPCSDC